MKSISTLIPDIYKLIQSKTDWFTEDLANDLSDSISQRLQVHYGQREDKPTLRLSKMGATCPHALWYSIHHPERAEPLPPQAMLKYSYGHILEAQTIALAKAAGHEVTGEQDELVVDGIKGHRDCVIDGCIVDVKSSATGSMWKFEPGVLGENDTFGYLDQLDGYLVGSSSDPLVRSKDRGYILAIDKQLGNMVLYEHTLREQSIRERIAGYKRIVEQPRAPACTCGVLEDGGAGNLKLDTKASYSAYKHICFPNLRTFIYSKGPVYLTKVGKIPTYKGIPLMEVDRHGVVVRH